MIRCFFIIGFFINSIAAKAQVIYGVNNYIQYHIGSLPIVISAPHGGLVTPASIPDRTCNNPTTVWDNNTIQMTRMIDTALFNLTGCRPHVVICNLRRTKIDCNRNLADGACGNSEAEVAWKEFSYFIDTAQWISKSQYNGKAFYVDMHAHGKTNQRLELGYGLTSTTLKKSDSVLNLSSSLTNSSLNSLASTNVSGSTHAQLLRGTNSLGTMLVNAGFPSVPSQQFPDPDTFAYFNGGYNTFNHTCIATGNTVNGLQIETPQSVWNTYANQKKFADSIAKKLVMFLFIHQHINFLDCKRLPPNLGNIPSQNLILSTAFNIPIRTYVTITNGDSILSYNLNGTLPSGYSFDSITGILSGTSTALGTYPIVVKCRDIDGYSNTDSFDLIISPVPNNKPKANNDSYSLNDGKTIVVNPRFNDIDIDGDSLEIVLIGAVSKGNVSITNSSKNIQYTAPLNYGGIVFCQYKISDGKGGIDSAIINFNIIDTSTASNSILIEANHGILVYPNPTDGNVFVDLGESYRDVDGEVFDITGKSILKIKIPTKSSRINLSHLERGLYFLELKKYQDLILRQKIEKR